MIKPHLTEQELADDLADYFARISEEFPPLDVENIPKTYDREVQNISPGAIGERLVLKKKPKSSVSIDPLSKMVEKHADLFACPLARVINLVRTGRGWPEL